MSDDYANAATAVAAENGIGRQYLATPSPALRASHSAAARRLVNALSEIATYGDAGDRTLMGHALTQHRRYLDAVNRMFAKVDHHDSVAAQRIARAEVRPAFDTFNTTVAAHATTEHSEAMLQLDRLQRLERLTSRLTPIVFLLGLLTTALLTFTARGYRRVLDIERARALHDSLHDPLTGLPNRALLADRFDQALHADTRVSTATGLLLVDLDRFKEINDTFGHHYGDELLIQIGPRMSAAVRDSDTVARLGGDEFAVLLPDVADLNAATEVAAKIRLALETPFHINGVDLDVEASIGVVLSGDHGDDAQTLLQRADVAMYVAKTQNLGVFAYQSDADEHSPAKLALLGELRRALERNELVLHYQPQICVDTGEVVSVEALIRWQHPTRGLMFPDAFIPAAEHTSLIGPLTRYVLDKALAQGRLWADIGRPLPIAVNLSARNLLDDRLPEQVATLLAKHDLSPHLVTLEVTESAIMTQPARAQRLLQQLARLGTPISIDDFGAGYTSLSLLKTLPVSELKIDRSFVMTMTEDPQDAFIVQSVIDLGHHNGLSIVAEGVENAHTLTMLAAYGCDTAQGYHIARPEPLDTFETWMLDQPTASTTPTSPSM